MARSVYFGTKPMTIARSLMMTQKAGGPSFTALYALNATTSTVAKILPSGVVTNSWATLALVPLSGICDSSGNLYVISTSGNPEQITKITPAGTKTDPYVTLSTFTTYNNPVRDSSNNIYTGDSSENVAKLTPAGSFNATWGHYPSGTHQVTNICIDSSGTIYAVNPYALTMSKFTSAAALTDPWVSFTGLASISPAFPVCNPINGDIYVMISTAARRMDKITSAGAYTASWQTWGTGIGPRTPLINPTTGDLYVIGTAGFVSQIPLSTGTLNSSWANAGNTGLNCTHAIMDSNGNIYTANQTTSTISMIKPDGTWIEPFATLTAGSGPVYLALA